MSATTLASPVHSHRRGALTAGALIGVLGVVYGDIGTSPLYAFQSVLALFPRHHATDGEILGCLSLIFWSLFLIVTVKYVLLVMQADNRGEGGILALMALAQRTAVNPAVRRTIVLIGIGGACLLFGDGVITPAISVLSARRGHRGVAAQAAEVVLPVSAVVIYCAVCRAVARHGRGGASVRAGHGGLVRRDRRARRDPDRP